MKGEYTKKERVVHSVLFEVISSFLIVLFTIAFSNKNPTQIGFFSIAMSLTAMIWNYYYNIIFDNIFGDVRINRTLLVRILHGFCFELGLMVVSLPLLMIILEESLFVVFIINVGYSSFYLIYAIIFNFIYDKIREKILNK